MASRRNILTMQFSSSSILIQPILRRSLPSYLSTKYRSALADVHRLLLLKASVVAPYMTTITSAITWHSALVPVLRKPVQYPMIQLKTSFTSPGLLQHLSPTHTTVTYSQIGGSQNHSYWRWTHSTIALTASGILIDDENDKHDTDATNEDTIAYTHTTPIVLLHVNVYSLAQSMTHVFQSLAYAARVFFRLFWLAALYSPLIIGFPIWFTMERHHMGNTGTKPRMWWVDWLVWTIEMSGPTFTKLGQWASSRADLLPPFMCQALSRLQANIKPHSMSHSRHLIESSFGESLEELFVRFDPIPIGCGSVAQVHYAELRTPGTADGSCSPKKTCVVKVIHPLVRELISLDLAILSASAAIVTFLFPSAKWLSFSEEVETFGNMMIAQLDLTNERTNLMTFQKNFCGWGSVGFPVPVDGKASPDVLVESYVDAVSMTKFLELGGGGFEKDLAQIVLTCFLKMLILDNFVHADMHPGNVLVSFHRKTSSKHDLEFIEDTQIDRLKEVTDVSKWNQMLSDMRSNDYTPYLYIVDTGLVSSLSQTHLVNFIDLFKAISEFNGNKISQLMISRSKSPWTVIDADGFQSAMSQFIQDIKHRTFALKNIRVADILGFVLSKVRIHHVKIEGDFVNIAISVMLLEGMGQQLEPSMDLLRASVPFLRKAISQRLDGHVSYSELSVWNTIRSVVSSYFIKEE
ncbi:hypothetical protein BASA83_004728 [Batrachochytrium salamandrivorans]|nr:hypothetical protein BASA83_004728 [Batrachochytrium salamandrivorans]